MDSGDIDRLLADVKLLLDNEDLGNAFYEKLTERSGIRLIDFVTLRSETAAPPTLSLASRRHRPRPYTAALRN